MFSDILKDLRKTKKITQEELAKLIGVERSTVGKWESRNVIPPADMLIDLSELFSVSVDYLLGKTNIKNSSDIDKEQYIFPEEFTDPDEARAYVDRHQIFGLGGFDADRLDDNEILQFANELLSQMKMVSYKYKK